MRTNRNDSPNGADSAAGEAKSWLLLEGALGPPGVAIWREGELLAVRELPSRRGADGDLVQALLGVLEEASIELGEIDGIVAGIGPGSFTGLRVVLGLVQGLACGRGGLPLVGVDSLRLVARAAGASMPAHVAWPWGRLRVLLATATEGAAAREPATLVPRTELAAEAKLVGHEIFGPRSIEELDWPEGAVIRGVDFSPVRALAAFVPDEAPAPSAALEPFYLLAPDAVLPARPALETGLTLAPLLEEHLESVVAIEEASFPHPWTPAMLRDEIALTKGRHARGAFETDGGLAGYLLGRHDEEHFEILSVAVDPGRRGQGAGRALVREAIDAARGAGMSQVDLEVSVSNGSAIALYASEGFVPVGRRPRYYQDGSDALLMSLVLRRS